MTSSDLSINYQHTPTPARDNRNILFPGVGEPFAYSGNKSKKEEGIVITPTPSIVIKTRLLKSCDGSSKSSILSISSDNGTINDTETKVFINICSHDVISLPTKRATIDEESGREVDGWHLPMSMGELRPCFDKSGNAAIVADCIMNTRVVNDMHNDSNHFHFVCDLVIQCATRKFSKPCFGGLELDKRYKVPKMKYAGYVDEKSGLPFDARMVKVNGDIKPAVAKQRVKGSGKSKPMIEEVDSSPVLTSTQPAKPPIVSESKQQQLPLVRIELFVEFVHNKMIPLQDFLDIIAKDIPTGALQRHVSSPELKHIEPNDSNLHPSQLLKTPIPCGCIGFDAMNIIAKCTTDAPSNLKIEASAFQIVLSSSNYSKTACVVPFPIDSRKTKCTFITQTKSLEIKMPLLQSAMKPEDGPDPGTKQWGLANAFTRASTEDDPVYDEDDGAANLPANYFDIRDADSEDDDEKLPEDVFHSTDALSRHYLQQQEEEQQSKRDNHAQMLANLDGGDTEFINVEDFQPGGKYFAQETSEKSANIASSNATLKRAGDVLKRSLGLEETRFASDFAYDLV